MQPPIRRRAALFGFLCVAGAILLAVLVLWTSVLTIHDVQVVPTFSYLAALAFLGHAFTEIARGRGFRPAALRGLRWCGCALIFGGLYATFAVPVLQRALTDAGPDKFVDIASLIVAFVGVALIMLASLLGHAQLLEAELEQIL